MIYRNKKEMITSLIQPSDIVLDVGFWGQGIRIDSDSWPHRLLKERCKDLYGLDISFDKKSFPSDHYQMVSAEKFVFPLKFDVIFAGDLIEHLSNPGLFLESCLNNLKPEGRLVITTPNTFNLFNLAEKITKTEPTVNHDHTVYFNQKVLAQLLGKNGFEVTAVDFIYTLDYKLKESWKKKFLNVVYRSLSVFTDKFVETLVVTAKISPHKNNS